MPLKCHIKHLLELSDTQFQTHYSFIFTIFNVLQRRNILLHSSLKIDCRSFDMFRSDFAMVSPSAVWAVGERLLRGDYETCLMGEEKRVWELLKQVSHVTSNVQGLSSALALKRNEIRGLMVEKGLPSFYVMINPADVYNPVLKFMSGDEFDVDDMMSNDVLEYWAQSILVATNPAITLQFFHLYMTTLVCMVLVYDCFCPHGLGL